MTIAAHPFEQGDLFCPSVLQILKYSYLLKADDNLIQSLKQHGLYCILISAHLPERGDDQGPEYGGRGDVHDLAHRPRLQPALSQPDGARHLGPPPARRLPTLPRHRAQETREGHQLYVTIILFVLKCISCCSLNYFLFLIKCFTISNI